MIKFSYFIILNILSMWLLNSITQKFWLSRIYIFLQNHIFLGNIFLNHVFRCFFMKKIVKRKSPSQPIRLHQFYFKVTLSLSFYTLDTHSVNPLQLFFIFFFIFIEIFFLEYSSIFQTCFVMITKLHFHVITNGRYNTKRKPKKIRKFRSMIEN